MTEDNKGGPERNRPNLKIPTFRLLVSSEVGRELALVSLEARFEFLQNILTFLHFISGLLHLDRDGREILKIFNLNSSPELTSI